MELQSIKDWLGSGSINIFGRPFAGKDTQGEILAELFAGKLLGGGDILRGSIIPPHVKAEMEAGRLIPTSDYIDIVLPYLSQENLMGIPLILSSVGRWHGEEEGVINATKQSGHEQKAVIYIDLPEGEVKARWDLQDHSSTRGFRQDDTLEALEIRLKEFRDKTLPVIDYYRDLGLLIEIDGSLPIDEVKERILVALANRVSSSL